MIQIPETVRKRNEERVERLVKKKEGEEENLNKVFWETFKAKQNEIESLLESVKDLEDRPDITEVFHNVSKHIQALTKYVSTSSFALIPYELRMTRTILQELQGRARETEERLLPKRKFGFSKITVENKTEKLPLLKLEDAVDNTDSDSLSCETGFTCRISEVLTLQKEELLGKDVVLSKLEKCDVYLLGSYNTLQATHISCCRIFSGPATTSVIIDDCKESLFFVACQQLRIHQTTSTDFYIHVTTKAIIEDSTKIRFAPYTFFYDSLGEDYHASGLDPLINHWDEIDDFNWLVMNKKSPNWRTIDENERIILNK